MRIYIIILFVVLFNIYLETTFTTINIFNHKFKSRKVSFFTCFLLILILGIIRNESLGVDVDAYRSYFLGTYSNLNIKFFIGNFNYDLGYVLLNKVVRFFTNDFRIFEILVYCLSFGIFSTIIFKESKFPALSFLIYIGLEFIGFNMCILRQSIACALCFLAFYCLEKNKKAQYFLLVILAVLFHKTAILFLLVYFLTINKQNLTSYLYNIIFAFLFFLLLNLVFPKVFGFYSNDHSSDVVTGQGYKLLLFYIIVTLLTKIILHGNNSKGDIMKYNSSLGSVYMQTGALSFALFTRVTKYFAILFTLSVPNIVYTSKYRKIYIVIYSIMFSILYIYGLYSNELKIVPFKSFM